MWPFGETCTMIAFRTEGALVKTPRALLRFFNGNMPHARSDDWFYYQIGTTGLIGWVAFKSGKHARQTIAALKRNPSFIFMSKGEFELRDKDCFKWGCDDASWETKA